MEYQRDADSFIVTDPLGQVRAITGYPVQEIAKAEGRKGGAAKG